MGLLATCHPIGASALSSNHQSRRPARPTARHAAAATPNMALPPSVSSSRRPWRDPCLTTEWACGRRWRRESKRWQRPPRPPEGRELWELRGAHDLLSAQVITHATAYHDLVTATASYGPQAMAAAEPSKPSVLHAYVLDLARQAVAAESEAVRAACEALYQIVRLEGGRVSRKETAEEGRCGFEEDCQEP